MGCSSSIEQKKDINSLEKEIIEFYNKNYNYIEQDGTYAPSIVDEAIKLGIQLHFIVGNKHYLYVKLNHFIAKDYRKQ